MGKVTHKVSVELTPEEFEALTIIFAESEQVHWTLEQELEEGHYALCGYFEGDSKDEWERFQEQIPSLKGKKLRNEIVQDQDWSNAYKRYLRPEKIGPLHIIPIWKQKTYIVPENEFGIYLDAEMAFGTGAHETTQLCLARLVEYRRLFPKANFEKQMIDVGCGSGILSIAAAKLGFSGIYGFDIDPDAIKISKKNAEQNHALGIHFEVADLKFGILGKQTDFVSANVLAPILVENASILVNTVRKYGCLSLSGILSTEVESVKEAFTPLVERYWDAFFANVKTLGQWSEIAYVRT